MSTRREVELSARRLLLKEKKSAFKVRAPLGLLRRDSLRQLSPDWRRSAPRKVRSAADKLGGRKAGRTKPAAKKRSRGTRAFRLACQAEAQKTTNACWAANGTPWAPLKCLATLLSNAHIAPHITEKTMHDAELPPRSLAPCCPRNNPSLGRSQRIRRCTGGQCRLCSACKNRRRRKSFAMHERSLRREVPPVHSPLARSRAS